MSIQKFYQYLKTINNGIYAKYDGITYDQPSENILPKDDWVMQFPNHWGMDIDKYNLSFTAMKGQQVNPTYLLPDCSKGQGYGFFSEPYFTTDLNDNKHMNF